MTEKENYYNKTLIKLIKCLERNKRKRSAIFLLNLSLLDEKRDLTLSLMFNHCFRVKLLKKITDDKRTDIHVYLVEYET